MLLHNFIGSHFDVQLASIGSLSKGDGNSYKNATTIGLIKKKKKKKLHILQVCFTFDTIMCSCRLDEDVKLINFEVMRRSCASEDDFFY